MTSPAFAEGQPIPVVHACDGANTSPQLDWGTAPDGAMSYSLVFTDLSNSLIHWVIYDIPVSATGLPADIDKVFMPPDVAGAKQTLSFNGGVRGYLGPCPPTQHTYEFKLYAVDVATLPGTTMNTTRAQAETIILQHDIASATLSGTYERP
jgi:Raf kinase inhibitor-like YbhB/YbcL family protein